MTHPSSVSLQNLAANLVEFIKTLPAGTEISLSQLIGECSENEGIECDFVKDEDGWFFIDVANNKEIVRDDDLFELQAMVKFLAAREGIKLDSSAYEYMLIGLPYNIPFKIVFGAEDLKNPEPFHLCAIRMPVRTWKPLLWQYAKDNKEEKPVIIFNSTVSNREIHIEKDDDVELTICTQPLNEDTYTIAIISPSFDEKREILNIGYAGEEYCFEYKDPMLNAYTPWLFWASKNPIDANALVDDLLSEDL